MTGPGSPPDASTLTASAPFRLPSWKIVVAVAAAVRAAAVLLIPVLPEEAYHWLYAKHLALSYYDHPPMVAWLIALGSALFGDTAAGVRFFPWLCSIVTAAAASWTAGRLLGPRAASWTALLIAVQPATFFASAFGFPDAGMLAFWSLALAFVAQALETRTGAWWLAAGAALGAGMLSKYTAAFLGASLLLYLLVTPKDRFWLKTIWPYAGAVLALVVFSPVIVWNATHAWASFRFQSVGRLEEGGPPKLSLALAYPLLQLASVAPLVAPVAVLATLAGFRSRLPVHRFLLCLSLPMLAFFFVVGISRSTHAFWPLPAWIALTMLMADLLDRGTGRLAAFYRKTWKLVAAVSALAAGLAIAHFSHPVPGVPVVRSLRGWNEIGARAERLRSGLPAGSFYLGVGRRYLCPAQLAFHVPVPTEVHAKNLLNEDGLGFAFWDSPESLRGRDAVIVAEEDWSVDLGRLLGRHFERVEPDGAPLSVGRLGARDGAKEERYVFFIGRGYRPLPRP
jgi:dolichol-phosphate mannosyltransferase